MRIRINSIRKDIHNSQVTLRSGQWSWIYESNQTGNIEKIGYTDRLKKWMKCGRTVI
jgi:hypothetical protein